MQHSSVRRLFQEQVKHYSRPGQAISSPIVDHFLTWAKKKKTKKSLRIGEFGGGAGQLLDKIGEYYPKARLTNVEIVGDYQRYLVSPKIKFVKGSILDSPFLDKSFDVLIIRDVLHHLVGRSYQETSHNQRRALQELKRLIQPGGVIFIEELTNSSEIAARIIYFLSKVNSRLGMSFPSFRIGHNTIVSFFTPTGLRQLCESVFGSTGRIKKTQDKQEGGLIGRLFHLGAKLEKSIFIIQESAKP